jgi:hypothetical protein
VALKLWSSDDNFDRNRLSSGPKTFFKKNGGISPKYSNDPRVNSFAKDYGKKRTLI